MRFAIASSDNKQAAVGQLQDDEIVYAISNTYIAPFEALIGRGDLAKAFGLVLQGAAGVTNKHVYQFTQYWDSQAVPELTFKVAFGTGDDDPTAAGQILTDMFSVETSVAGFIEPPGGLFKGDLSTRAAAVLKSGNYKDFFSSQDRSRTVNIAIGTSPRLLITGMLPERVEIRGKLPLRVTGAFSMLLCTITVRSSTISMVGLPLLGRE